MSFPRKFVLTEYGEGQQTSIIDCFMLGFLAKEIFEVNLCVISSIQEIFALKYTTGHLALSYFNAFAQNCTQLHYWRPVRAHHTNIDVYVFQCSMHVLQKSIILYANKTSPLHQNLHNTIQCLSYIASKSCVTSLLQKCITYALQKTGFDLFTAHLVCCRHYYALNYSWH